MRAPFDNRILACVVDFTLSASDLSREGDFRTYLVKPREICDSHFIENADSADARKKKRIYLTDIAF